MNKQAAVSISNSALQISSANRADIPTTNGGGGLFGPVNSAYKSPIQPHYAHQFNNKAVYIGPHPGSRFNGPGILTLANGDMFSGTFTNGLLNGKGSYIGHHGDIYVGEFQRHQIHGKGTLIFATGDMYVGEFQNGQYHGQGTLIYSNGNTCSTFENGQWITKGTSPDTHRGI